MTQFPQFHAELEDTHWAVVPENSTRPCDAIYQVVGHSAVMRYISPNLIGNYVKEANGKNLLKHLDKTEQEFRRLSEFGIPVASHNFIIGEDQQGLTCLFTYVEILPYVPIGYLDQCRDDLLAGLLRYVHAGYEGRRPILGDLFKWGQYVYKPENEGQNGAFTLTDLDPVIWDPNESDPGTGKHFSGTSSTEEATSVITDISLNGIIDMIAAMNFMGTDEIPNRIKHLHYKAAEVLPRLPKTRKALVDLYYAKLADDGPKMRERREKDLAIILGHRQVAS